MISVCMASYNGEKYIERQIRSIIDQLDETDELIISDDGSTDRTREIIQSLVEERPLIRLIDGPGKGVLGNFDNALRYARGSIVFLSDQDDVWAPSKVREMLEVFESTGCLLVTHDAEMVDSNLVPLGKTVFNWRKSKPGLIANLTRNSFVGCCMAFRRSLLKIALPIPDTVEMHDWWLGLIAEIYGEVQFFERPLICYRRHESNVSGLSHYSIGRMVWNRTVMAFELVKRYAKYAKYQLAGIDT